MSAENQDTSSDILEARYRSKRNQATLNIELALSGAAASSQGAGGSVGGSVGVGSSPVIIEGGGSGGQPPCPELNQYVLVQGDSGVIAVKVISVKNGAFLWNPISNGFEKVTCDEIVDSPLIRMSDGWIYAVGSPSHPPIRNEKDTTGLALEKCKEGQDILAYAGQLKTTSIKTLENIGEGQVKRLETEGPGHIYCAGSDPDELFVFHNTKRANEDL